MGVRRVLLDENGNLILMTLIIFLVLSILGTTVISIAGMENKISRYALNAQQAQQAADAGAEWAIEQIWNQGMPESFQEELLIGDMINSRVEVTNRQNEVIDEGDGTPLSVKSKCRYQFMVHSEYRGAKKELAVELVYFYSGTNHPQREQVEIVSYTYD